MNEDQDLELIRGGGIDLLATQYETLGAEAV